MSRIHTAAGVAAVASVVAGSCLACSSGQNTPYRSSAPSTTSAVATGTSPSPAPAQPVLDGLYRQFIDGPNSTYNGAPRPAGPALTQWWAFRSACTATGCVATSTQLNDDNHNIAKMPPTQRVYRFTNGGWEWAHDEVLDCENADGSPAPGSANAHYVTRLVPRPDGTLSGASTSVALDDGCGDEGATIETPTTYAREGEVPPDVPMMDPTKVG